MGIFKYFKDDTLNFSEALGSVVRNEDGKKIGTLSDFFVNYDEVYPTVIAIQYRRNKQLFYVAWEEISFFSSKRLTLHNNFHEGRSRTFPKIKNEKIPSDHHSSQYIARTEEYPAIGKIILDRQIVDIAGKKVVRVNDIQFIKTGKLLKVTYAAIGLRSMVRRLGFEKPIDKTIKLINPHAKYLTNDKFINWRFVHAIPDRSVQENVRLSLTNEDLQKIHPADLADILEDLDTHGREQIFHTLDPEKAAQTLSEVEEDLQASFIKHESAENAAKIIENMGTDEAADVLNDLSEDKKDEIISKIKDDEIQEEILELLEYEENTAGGLMSTEVFEISPELKKTEVLQFIQNEYDDIESIYDIFIIDKCEKLIGTCSLTKLLINKKNVIIGDIMESTDLKSLSPETHWKAVATFMSKYNLINVPIVNEQNKLIGIITVDDILPWLLKEKQ